MVSKEQKPGQYNAESSSPQPVPVSLDLVDVRQEEEAPSKIISYLSLFHLPSSADTSEILNVVLGFENENIKTSAECFALLNLGPGQGRNYNQQ